MRELELIGALKSVLGRPSARVLRWIGDDAAVVRADGVAVTSIDTITEGTHFDRDTHSPFDIGHKALAQALSDLAAMGARAGEAYVSLVLGPDIEDHETLELVRGIARLADACETTIAGGDVAGGRALTVTVAVTGWARNGDELCGRDGAQPGDLVGVTGRLGGSAGGLGILTGELSGLDEQAARRLAERHRRPLPKLAAGRALAALGATAMIDLSDGLATDARQLAEASFVALDLETGAIPVDEALAGIDSRRALELALSGGEDYELLFTCPRASWPESGRAGESELSRLGAVVAGEGLALGGIALDDDLQALRGFEHL